MKKVLILIAMLLASTLLLISCGEGEEEAPEGLQIVEISREHGFKFYGPDRWTVISSGLDTDTPVWGARMSTANRISVTLAKTEMPEGVKLSVTPEEEKAAVTKYFSDSFKDFPENMEFSLVTEPMLANFGNAESAYKCVYTYRYGEMGLAVMQYAVINNEDFYLFTYTSHGDVSNSESEYNFYLDRAESCVESFVFTDKEEVSAVIPEYDKDSDGYKLVSDKKLTGFDFYIPESAEVISSAAYVNAKLSNKANISIAKSDTTGVSIVDYLKMRKSGIEYFFGEVKDIKIEFAKKPEVEEARLKELFEPFDVELPLTNELLAFGDLEKGGIVLYEYTYTYHGVSYHVLQVIGVDSSNGYVFTYTATEDEFNKFVSDGTISKILEKVKF